MPNFVGEERLILVLIGGGHCSGKKTVRDELKNQIQSLVKDAVVESIDLESFEIENLDGVRRPQRFDFQKVGLKINEIQKQHPKVVVIVTGFYALYDKQLRSKASMKVFVDCDADTRLDRWIKRDVLQEKKGLQETLDTYLLKSRPEFNEFIILTKEYADVILPSEHSETGISLICDGLTPLLTGSDTISNEKLSSGYETALNIHSETYDYRKKIYYDLS